MVAGSPIINVVNVALLTAVRVEASDVLIEPHWRFFFSSRRRHTMCGRDWSSDVCSSDLITAFAQTAGGGCVVNVTPYPGKPPAHVTFTTQPPPAVWANAVMSPAVQVTVTDASGAPVRGGAARLAIGTSPSPGATLSGTKVARIVDGVATFADLGIDQVGRGYTLVAAAGRVSEASAAFAIVEPATHLAFVTQPPANVEGGTAMQPVRVAIQDALGKTLTTASAPVTVALA